MNKWLFHSNKIVFVLSLIVLMGIKVGVWYMPNLHVSHAISLNPFHNPMVLPEQDYMMSSWFSSFLAWVLHIKTFKSYFIFHLCCSIVFLLSAIRYAFWRFDDQLARISVILFFLFPASATSFFWVGMDSMTLCLLFFITLSILHEQFIFIFILSILAGMNHFEQCFLATGLLFFAKIVSWIQKQTVCYSWKAVFLSVTGIVLGKLILSFIFYSADIRFSVDRADLLVSALGPLIQTFVFRTQLIIWSILGVGWFVCLKYCLDKKTVMTPLMLTLGLAIFFITPLVGDQTRVLSIVLFPLIMVFLLYDKVFLSSIRSKEVTYWCIAWVMIPWIWVWGGQSRWSVFPYDISLLLHVPEQLDLWPFQ